MRSLFAFSLLSMLALTPAIAADMTVYKAPLPKAPACTLQSCSGWVVGAGFGNMGGNFDVIGTGLTGLAENGLSLGGRAGYEFWNGQYYAAMRLVANYDYNIDAPVSGITDRFSYGAIASVGYSLASAVGLGTTGQAAPTIGGQLLNSIMTPYVNGGIMARHKQEALVSGAGIEALIAANWTLNVDYYHYNYGGGSASGVATRTTENEARVSLNYHFGNR